MSSRQFDVAVVGSTPSANLLAALVGADHSARVVLVHNRARRGGLARTIDIGTGLITRPASWHMATSGTRETMEWLTTHGARQALARHDLVMVAASGPDHDFLGHVRAMADHFGYETRRPAGPTKSHKAILIRDVNALIPDSCSIFSPRWLADNGVVEVPFPAAAAIGGDETQGLAFEHEGEKITAGLGVLMDEDAARLFGQNHPALKVLSSERYTALHVGGRWARFADGAGLLSGFDVTGFHARANATFVARGERGAAARNILAAAPEFGEAEVVGRVVFDRLETPDGAPVVSFDASAERWLVAGLGPQGPFLMPSLARYICQCARPDEARYWQAHGVLRGMTRRDLAEWVPAASRQAQ
jgi:hypothetical protein